MCSQYKRSISASAAGRAAPLGDEVAAGVRRIYDERFRAAVHDRW